MRYPVCRTSSLVATAGLLAVSAVSSLAGQWALKVTDVQLNQVALYPHQIATLSYTLTGSGLNATGGLSGVQIQFLKDSTAVKTIPIAFGQPGAVAGANSVVLNADDIPVGGPYTVKIVAQGGSVTGTDYIKASSTADPNLQFTNPRGIDVNRNAGSPYLGRIYVTEGAAGGAKNRITTEGVYVLNPDLSPAFANAKATSSDIGTLGPWAASAHSPFRVYIAPDSTVFLTDASDAHPAVIYSDPDLTTFTRLFATPPEGGAQATNGLVTDSLGSQVFGDTTSIWIEGAGADRKVFAAIQEIAPTNTIWRYDIPEGQSNVSMVPTLVASPTITGSTTWYNDFVRDAAGNTYAVNYNTPGIGKFDSSGNLVASIALPTATTVGCSGICIDESRDMILACSIDGKVFKTNKALDSVTPILTGLGAINRDVCIDKDGWVYVVNETDKALYVFAPAGTYIVPDGSGTSAQTLSIYKLPTAGDIWPVGPAGVNLSSSGNKFGDDKVDLNDAAYALRVYAGLNQVP